MKYNPPVFGDNAFTCPLCLTYSYQTWYKFWCGGRSGSHGGREIPIDEMAWSECGLCDQKLLWLQKNIEFPNISVSEPVHEDMPEDVKADYVEAASIVNKSPRGAAALLRLGIQKLCKCLGETGKDINSDIGNLVKKGLPVEIQQALDIVRVIGNESVHPGELDMKDDRETAIALFGLMNYIVEDRIARPQKLKAFYDTLPESKRKGIENRDKINAN